MKTTKNIESLFVDANSADQQILINIAAKIEAIAPNDHVNAVYFIDSSLPDLATLQAGLPQSADIHLLNAQQDGLQQIAAALENRTDITALHLITHGAPGQLFLGHSAVDREMLRNARTEMEAIANAMRENGELLIYGCEVAAGKEGRAFVQALRDTTGLRVAAASHKVGHSELGAIVLCK